MKAIEHNVRTYTASAHFVRVLMELVPYQRIAEICHKVSRREARSPSPVSLFPAGQTRLLFRLCLRHLTDAQAQSIIEQFWAHVARGTMPDEDDDDDGPPTPPPPVPFPTGGVA